MAHAGNTKIWAKWGGKKRKYICPLGAWTHRKAIWSVILTLAKHLNTMHAQYPGVMQGSQEGKRAKLWGPRAHFGANISMKISKCFANFRITDQIAFLCVHAPRGLIDLRFLPSSSPQRRKPGYAALLRMGGNYFRPNLSIHRVCHRGAAYQWKLSYCPQWSSGPYISRNFLIWTRFVNKFWKKSHLRTHISSTTQGI